MTIGDLRVLAERLFKIKAAQQALCLRLPDNDQPRSLGKDDTQPLSFFEVEVRHDVCKSCLHLVSVSTCRFEAHERCDADADIISPTAFKHLHEPLCVRQDGSQILISEEDVIARASKAQAAQQADAAMLERRMDRQLKARSRQAGELVFCLLPSVQVVFLSAGDSLCCCYLQAGDALLHLRQGEQAGHVPQLNARLRDGQREVCAAVI